MALLFLAFRRDHGVSMLDEPPTEAVQWPWFASNFQWEVTPSILDPVAEANDDAFKQQRALRPGSLAIAYPEVLVHGLLAAVVLGCSPIGLHRARLQGRQERDFHTGGAERIEEKCAAQSFSSGKVTLQFYGVSSLPEQVSAIWRRL